MPCDGTIEAVKEIRIWTLCSTLEKLKQTSSCNCNVKE